MYLERVEIVGFRGINRLSVQFAENNTVLIGENAWGKSSLLDALTLLLAPEVTLYRFELRDFHYPPGDETARERHLHILLTFREREVDEHRLRRYRALSRVWVVGDDEYRRIHYRLEAETDNDDVVVTWRDFLDEQGQPLRLHNIEHLALSLIQLHPVLRLRDTRFTRRLNAKSLAPHLEKNDKSLANQLDELTKNLVINPQKMSNKALREGLSAIQQLLDHFFAEQQAEQSSVTRSEFRRKHLQQANFEQERHAWHSLDNINRIIINSGSRSMRLILLGMFSTLLQAKGAILLDRRARPLLLIEEPETRLHPIMLSVAWRLLEQLPLQKIATTNSGELLSLTSIEQVCRLVRHSNRVMSYRLHERSLSVDDNRRIAFHIRLNRASALFARAWLLVEGETEIWLLNEFARLCGYDFHSEGVKIIEFAQCGVKPLVKFAQKMGIEWHVLVDGDEAGRKYASIVRSLLMEYEHSERDHLTILPTLDMEQFLYRQGFRDVFHEVAGLPSNAPLSMRRVIEKAIHRSSKPDLAIIIAAHVERMGLEFIPTLFKTLFSRVLWLARGRAD